MTLGELRTQPGSSHRYWCTRVWCFTLVDAIMLSSEENFSEYIIDLPHEVFDRRSTFSDLKHDILNILHLLLHFPVSFH